MAVESREVLSRINIVDIVSEYLPLKKYGANFKAVCPFHNDHDPSLTVNDQKQIFNCFVCHTGGDAIKFISLMENISYRDAKYKLCDRLGIEYKVDNPEDDQRKKIASDIKSLNKEVAKFYYDQLRKSETGINYLKKRGMRPETANQFGLGFANDNWSDVYDHFTKTGISKDLLLKAGLITERNQGGKISYYDKFRARLIFPIFDEFGDVIGFGGRIIDQTDKNIPKYLNSQDTPAYKKGYHLYGMNLAKKSRSKVLIVVEGYMDCIALHSKGINYAVASLGTALTEYQARLIKNKGFTTVILAYDSDSAGKAATLRGMDILKAQGLDVHIFRLQGAKDADEYLRTHSKEDFEKQLKNTFSLVEYKIMLAAEEFPPDTNEHVISFVKRVKNILNKLDETEFDIYSSWVLENYGEKYKIYKENLKFSKPSEIVVDNDIQTKRIYVDKSKDVILTENEKKIDAIEKQLIVVLAENPVLIEQLTTLNEEIFTLDENVKLFRKAVDLRKNKALLGVKTLFDGSNTDSVLSETYANFTIDQGKEKAVSCELIEKLKYYKLLLEIELINNKLKDKTLNQNEIKDLLLKMKDLNEKKKNFKV